MTDTNSNKLLVWRVEQLFGPDDLSDEALDDGIEAVAVVMVSDPEDPESYGDMDMFFDSFNDAYDFSIAVMNSMEPLEIEV
jgi:hypothetical protein